MSAANIDNILSRATDCLRALLEEAFEAGRANGREDIKREMLSVLMSVEQPSDIVPEAYTPELDKIAAERVSARAASGTVKPMIKQLIDQAADGISTLEIIEQTGFKENSVRGTLSTLKTDGAVERRGDLWFRNIPKSDFEKRLEEVQSSFKGDK